MLSLMVLDAFCLILRANFPPHQSLEIDEMLDRNARLRGVVESDDFSTTNKEQTFRWAGFFVQSIVNEFRVFGETNSLQTFANQTLLGPSIVGASIESSIVRELKLKALKALRLFQ